MSAKKRLEFTRKAFRDIAGIEEWIAVDNPKAAQDVAASILKTAEQLEVNPSLGRPGREDGTRELVLPKHPYILIYRLTAQRIRVLAVLHQSRKYG